MLKKLLTVFGILLVTQTCLWAQGTLKGTVKDAKTGELLGFVTVAAEQNGQVKGVGTSDMDGIYTIKPLAPGTYDVTVKFYGYAPVKITDVSVKASGFSVSDINMTSTSNELAEVVVTAQKVSLIEIGDPAQGTTYSSKDIERMPAQSVDGIAAMTAGVAYDDGGKGSVRGESGGMLTMVGNVKKRGSVNIPKKSIAELQFILGGTPAKFGEARGGVQVITLNPPSPTFSGQVQYETSELFDTRGYNKGQVYLTGPVLTKTYFDSITRRKEKKAIVGFRVAAYDSYIRDGLYRPHNEALYELNDDVRTDLENYPLYIDPVDPTVTRSKSVYYRTGDFSRKINKPNAWSNSVYVEGGLDFRFTDNMILAINGEYSWNSNRGATVANAWANSDNNSLGDSKSFQISADFTHKIPTKDSSSIFKNFMYTVAASYERVSSESQSSIHKKNFFDYGYVGKFTTTIVPTYSLQRKQVDGIETYVWEQTSFNTIGYDFNPSTKNTFVANYTSQIYGDARIRPNLYRRDDVQKYNGLLNGESPSKLNGAYGIFAMPGTGYGSYSKSQQDNIFVNVKASVDIKNHSLELGFQYDRSTNRSYSLTATSLWTLMYQKANSHISQMDLLNPIVDTTSGTYPVISYNRLVGDGQTYFDKSVRTKLNYSPTQWIDIDNLDPSFFSLDMFSPDDLFNSGNSYVSYNGYDHTGKIVNGKHSLQDFFNSSSRTLDAFTPIYMAGYIQDQFYISDLIFNVGIRVDRFDANQMVLKDPYLLYEAYTVSDEKVKPSMNVENKGAHPADAKGDWVVYVDQFSDPDRAIIKGYRSGSTWYDAKGVEISDPYKISGVSSQPTPFRKDKKITPDEVNVSTFKDYDPQYVFMPRIAFSFPVSDQSQFKASYDIIANRPSSAWQANYMAYMFMDKQSGILPNPNLKPERITNYEVGFEQALTKSSALKINAYYKETRDLIQLVQYTGADPNPSYYSVDNIDFKTTKGFTIQYDLRQTKNFRLIANYTLQYAEGTNLPQSTMESLIKAGYADMKILNPINDDIRNAFKMNLDYRFNLGKKYDGPKTTRKMLNASGDSITKTIKWLQGFGANLQLVAQSGKPYTRRLSNTQNTIVGSYNGARLPWQFFTTLVLNKDIPITVGKGESKKETMLTVELRINNLFNIRNITSVYPVTGDPDDNGYLTDPDTQSIIAAYQDNLAFRDMYGLYLDNNSYNNYSSPRRIVLSLIYAF